MATGAELVAKALTQVGKPYRLGAETRMDDPNPQAFDCSELVEWALGQLGVRFVDGSWNQCAACRAIPVSQARVTPGALVFVSRDGKASGVHHVGISRGDGYTVEARGQKYGVGVFAWRSSWNLAGLVPALKYESAASTRPAGTESYAVIFGDRTVPGVEARLIEGRAWVPLRAFAEFLGYEVHAPDLAVGRTIYVFEKGEDLP